MERVSSTSADAEAAAAAGAAGARRAVLTIDTRTVGEQQAVRLKTSVHSELSTVNVDNATADAQRGGRRREVDRRGQTIAST